MGLAGSLHCLGMCGPIFIASAGFYDTPWQYGRSLVLHHMGKIATYAGIGMFMGVLGLGTTLLWYQNEIMIFSGILLLILFVSAFVKIPAIAKANGWVVKTMGGLLRKHGSGSLILGLVNGLVPCGLVYAAAVGAAATQSIAGGTLFMVFFGLGTVPALSVIGFSRWLFPVKLKRFPLLWKQAPMAILAVWLLLKGLGLGIPFVSPDLNSHNPAANCCEKHHR